MRVYHIKCRSVYIKTENTFKFLGKIKNTENQTVKAENDQRGGRWEKKNTEIFPVKTGQKFYFWVIFRYDKSRMKKKRKKMRTICLMTMLCMGLSGCGKQQEPLTAAFLKVGKADAIVISRGEEALLIDTGEEDDGEKILEYMESQGIRQVQTMILTHFDKDHVGGADHILQGIPVEQVLEPDYAGSGKQYREYADTKENAGEVRAVTVEETFSFAGATVTVYPSALTLEDILDSGEKEYDNDLSLAVRLVDEDNTFWFLGDAKVLRIRELLDTEVLTGGCQVLKLPHHGRYSSETRPLLETVKPDNVVICCSGKNPPEEETLRELERLDIPAWETADGNVYAVSDGKTVRMRQGR